VITQPYLVDVTGILYNRNRQNLDDDR
jgi:hypothetical protein